MAKSKKSSRSPSTTVNAECDSIKISWQEKVSNVSVRRPEHRCYKKADKSKLSSNHDNRKSTVRVKLVKLKEPFRIRDCSRE